MHTGRNPQTIGAVASENDSGASGYFLCPIAQGGELIDLLSAAKSIADL